jgi:hypothetical protein
VRSYVAPAHDVRESKRARIMACAAVRGVDVLTELIFAGTTEDDEAAHHDDLPVQTTAAAVATGQPAVETTPATATATQPDQLLPVPGNGL